MSKLERVNESIEKISIQLDIRRGSIKVDDNEQLRHPKTVARLGEYADVVPLVSGDYAFDTVWGMKARVELKTFDNLISDISTRHVTDQLRKQVESGISILLLEGFVTCTMNGFIKTAKKEYKGRPWWWLWNYLTSVQLAGTYLYMSPNDYTTPKIIMALYEYCNKPEHESMGGRQKLISMHPTLNHHQRAFIVMPGIGDETATRLDKYFKSSVLFFSNASIEELMLAGQITKTKATNLYKYLRGEI